MEKMGHEANNIDEVPNKKEKRHIVSWSEEEDNILREQISLLGTESWTIIASNFKGKTSRQCRRRWIAYLSSDFKKQRWSAEEDRLLCEAQRQYGNRWTEIAKVVSGRTDNAVKNRFHTLCRKRSKQESMSKENYNINLNDKTVILANGLNAAGGSENACSPSKKMIRTGVSNAIESQGRLFRSPLKILSQNGLHSSDVNNSDQLQASREKVDSKTQGGMFLKKDDPKVLALIQQEQLLSSLATKVNSECLCELQKSTHKSKELEDVRISNGGSGSSSRESDMYQSLSACSEYSTVSTYVSCDKMEESAHTPIDGPQEDIGHEENDILTCNEVDGRLCEQSYIMFDSPKNVTPLFRSLAAAIRSPKFSESEKHFLMKTFGMESSHSSAIQSTNPSKSPVCKRSLFHRL